MWSLNAVKVPVLQSVFLQMGWAGLVELLEFVSLLSLVLSHEGCVCLSVLNFGYLRKEGQKSNLGCFLPVTSLPCCSQRPFQLSSIIRSKKYHPALTGINSRLHVTDKPFEPALCIYVNIFIIESALYREMILALN